jgi:DNA-binding transcriptional MerR regulator
VFRAQEVCELAEVQPYVLRSWEAEFPDLGFSKTANGPRIYRRGDVERVLRIKHLLFVDGLTLAGARRQLSQEGTVADDAAISDADVAALVDHEAKQSLRDVRRGLQWILGVLNGDGTTDEDRVLVAGPLFAGVGDAGRHAMAKRRIPPKPARAIKAKKAGRKKR